MSKVNFSGLKKMVEDIKRGYTSEKKILGDKILQLIKATISVGASPVRGIGRFKSYKDPKTYPAKQKKQSPVNLWLTGDMQNAMGAEVKGGKLFIGIKDTKQAGKLMTIQRGETVNGKVKLAGPRPVFPLAQGSTFTVKIMRDLTKWYKDMVQKAVNRQR
jgi:hypothetical protein